MSATLAIYVEFTDDSDLDFYRTRFVGLLEDAAGDAMDKEEGGKADGEITVGMGNRGRVVTETDCAFLLRCLSNLDRDFCTEGCRV